MDETGNKNSTAAPDEQGLPESCPPGAKTRPPEGEVLLNKTLDAINQAAPDSKKVHFANLWDQTDVLVAYFVRFPSRCTGLMKRIGSHRGLGGEAKELLADIRRKAKANSRRSLKTKPASDEPQEASALWNAPGLAGLVVPLGYGSGEGGSLDKVWIEIEADEKGNVKRTEKRRVIAGRPVLIVARTCDAATGAISVVLIYWTTGDWRRKLVPRDQIADVQQIVSLSRYDLDITSLSKAGLVAFLAQFEKVNIDVLPTAKTTSKLAWQGAAGREGFLWGSDLIRAESEGGRVNVDLSIANTDGWPEDALFLHLDEHHGPGAPQIAAAYRAGGTFEDWCTAIEPALEHTYVRVAIYAALCPVLFVVIPEADGFVVDYSSETSRGKTTILELAASLWGFPGSGGILLSWDATRVALTRVAALLGCGLPLLVDDTMRAKDPKEPSQFVYDLVSGSDRMRGTVTGLAATATFQSVLLSTGESPLTSATEHGGARARTLTLRGLPFGGVSSETARLVVELKEAVRMHYGHLGPRLVQWLCDNRHQRDQLRAIYRDCRAQWRECAAGHPVASRMASNFALLDLAGVLAHQVAGLPGHPDLAREALWEIWCELTVTMVDADPSRRALQQVREWASAHAAEFWGRHETVETEHGSRVVVPLRGWVGAWDEDHVWSYIAFIPTQLKKVLRELGHEPEGIISAWKRRGWLRRDGSRWDPKAIVHTDRPRCLHVTRAAFNEIEDAVPGGQPEADSSTGEPSTEGQVDAEPDWEWFPPEEVD